ncbi:DivIVA domain-containing protein [Paractinoplanes durhamensis]|uniref:Cell wall synthesis protein Wag31 n=1 Tax=Paractinoplanes durhamensis TaxID=113563 RepID=A0ABQ3Z2P1_9ACTN|nr:DivIVA domain-containing protein [Actinoplanes durhamensis]GIE04100.1 cell wall synthesis protein Wag31 [Actinoplanes durhamensis]
MPLTPADIHNMAFKKPPMGKRGYDEEEVDAFLDEVEQELIRLLEENNVLQDTLQRGGGGGLGGGPSSTQTNMQLNAELNDLVNQLDRLQEARARAEQNARNVQSELERSRNSALVPVAPVDDDRNARVLMMAQRTADDHMRDAQAESDQIIGSARGKAEQVTSEAQLNAATIESDARRNHSEAISSIGVKRTAMLEEIERLGQLAQSYHTALNNHVNQQLQELNGVPDGGIA